MAEATQFILTHRELTELLIKHQGLHEGHWHLMLTFGLGAGFAQTSPNDYAPTAMVAVQGVGLQKAAEQTPMTLNAAEVNPAA